MQGVLLPTSGPRAALGGIMVAVRGGQAGRTDTPTWAQFQGFAVCQLCGLGRFLHLPEP